MNKMREVRIDKITLNFGAGKDQNRLAKGEKLLKQLTGVNPVKTITNKRIQAWQLRPGLPIGVKVTLRNEAAKTLLVRLLAAKDNELSPRSFDTYGNVSFGIDEYVDITDAKYDPQLGMIGLEVAVTLKRPGYRIKKRKLLKRKIPAKHRVSKDDAMAFFKEKYNVSVGDNA